MAHHQGMSMMALSNFLNEFSIQKWFHREPKVMAVELFLHERVSLTVPVKTESPRPAKKGRLTAGLRGLKLLAVSQARKGSNGSPSDTAPQGTPLPNSDTTPTSPESRV
jgi:hypothetical protein